MDRKPVPVVDDHGPTRQAFTAFLLDRGDRVPGAEHGGEAVRHVPRRHREVVPMGTRIRALAEGAG